MILAGIDEAGYGPMLGPLVVSAAVFRAPQPPAAQALPDLWQALAGAVQRRPDGRSVPVNDSKKLFHQGRGLRNLEEGLLPFYLLRDAGLPRDFRALLRVVARRGGRAADAYLEDYPWYQGQSLELPRDTYPNVLSARALRLEAAAAGARVEFLGLASLPLEVGEFNRRVDATDSKAAVSFHAVGTLLKRLWRQFTAEAVHVAIDRQGGRTFYGRQLLRVLRPRGIRIEEEGPLASTYRVCRHGEAPGNSAAFRVTFACDSEETSLPVALASMLSKYIRELHMELFNRFWLARAQGVKPTAGYVTDARRFLADIAPLRRDLGVDAQLLVRKK